MKKAGVFLSGGIPLISNAESVYLAPQLAPVVNPADAYIAAAGFTNTALIAAIQQLFSDLIASGQYNKIRHLKLYLTDSTNNTTSLFQCGINAVNPSVGSTTFVNNPTANYSGVSFNGTTQYGILNYNVWNDAQIFNDDTTILTYAYSPAVAWITPGQRGNSGVNLSLTVVNNGLVQHFVNDFSATVPNLGISSASGLNAASRKSSAPNTKYLFKNNVSLTQFGSVPTGNKADYNMFEGGRTLDGVNPNALYNVRPQFLMVAKGMNPTDVAAIEPIINNFQGTVDTIFGLTGTSARKRY